MLAVSVNGALGHAGLLLMLAASCIGALSTGLAIVTGNRRAVRQATNYAWLILAGALVSTFAMQRALETRDYTIDYIQRVGSRTTPGVYNVAAMWSALEGSILLWVVVLAGFTAAVAWRFRSRADDDLVAWALVVMFVVCAFFALISFGPANPFAAGAEVGRGFDGAGPNPLLQNHILVLFHPPILYLGYVGFTVPFAFAIAALITGRVGEGWLLETRRWALFSWGFLTIGILLGGWWSYEVLGWSGVWAWDPVENASLLPWLTGTAYIHSVLVQQRRGMLRVWNLSLLVATFALTILGTFLTRSGIINSVHAFAAGQVDGYLLGTVFPLIVEAAQDRRTVVGAPYFNSLSMPIGIVLLFLMAVAPVLPWRKASEELLRTRLFWPAWCGAGALAIAVALGADGLSPLIAITLAGFAAGAALRQIVLATRRQGWRGLVGRANGGMIVHLGVILVALALVTSSAYTESTVLQLEVGEEIAWSGHTFELLQVFAESDARSDAVRADVRLDGGRAYAPAFTTYLQTGQTLPTPSVRTGLTHDVYLTIAGTNIPAVGATEVGIEVFKKPLILWMWVGGLLMALGTVLAAFPGTRRRNPLDPVSARIPAGTSGSTGTPSADETWTRPDDRSDDRSRTTDPGDAGERGVDEPATAEAVARD